eukprot:14127717-Alexandrium_andersonii.AAC.1
MPPSCEGPGAGSELVPQHQAYVARRRADLPRAPKPHAPLARSEQRCRSCDQKQQAQVPAE